jgi:hypothetical protein
MTPAETRAIYRDCGFPLVDQLLAGQIVASDAPEEEQDAQFMLLNAARDFTSDDPEVWAAGKVLDDQLHAVLTAQAEGASDVAQVEAAARRASAAAPLNVHLAAMALRRAGFAALVHILQRRLARN